MTMEILETAAAEHPYPLLFATVSGAHLYGFPSADSDYDLRGVHVLPVEELIGRCRFSNCTHTCEPGCAVRAALASGTLDAGLWQRYQALTAESDRAAQLAAKHEKMKQIAKYSRKNRRQGDEGNEENGTFLEPKKVPKKAACHGGGWPGSLPA